MTDDKSRQDERAELRRKAEAMLDAKSYNLPNDFRELYHELQTYKIELEMQNEELRSTQAELIESCDRYAMLYDFAPVGYVSVSKKGMILEANLTLSDMLGVDRGHLINQPLSAFVLSEDQDILYGHCLNIKTQQKRLICEIRMRKKDGDWFWARLESVLEESGGWVRSAITDITESKLAEEKIQSLARFPKENPNAVLRIDRNGIILYANPAAHACLLKMWGRQKGEIVPDDILTSVEEVFSVRQNMEIEVVGHNKTMSLTFSPVAGSDYINVYGLDITQRKLTTEALRESEKRYRAIVTDQTEYICRFDIDGNLIFVNDAYCWLFGVTCEEIINKRFIPHIYEKDRQIVENLFIGLNRKNSDRTIEHRVVMPNREVRWQQWTGRAIFDDYGEIMEYQAVGRDTTDTKRIQKELQKARQGLEQKVLKRTAELKKTYQQLLHVEKLGTIGRLSASIAHEFNNPLFGVLTVFNGIKNRATMVEEDAQLIDMAIQECHRMKDLISDLQDFNRPTSGVMNPTDIHRIIDNVILLSKKEYKTKKIRLKKKYSEKMPTILAVADQIQQVIMNLINNACDACESGDTVTITTKVRDKEIVMSFQDTGAGMEPEVMEHIFEPFFSTKQEVKGTGLGLSVSYGIIKRHNGNITVESRPGKGTAFTITLPVEGTY